MRSGKSVVPVGALGSVTVRDYHFTPESYLAMMREAVPGYDWMEDETVAATGAGAKSVLELGIGTGETARRVLGRHPEAKLIGIDASPGMVGVARDTLLPTESACSSAVWRILCRKGPSTSSCPRSRCIISTLTARPIYFGGSPKRSTRAAASSSRTSWRHSTPRTS
jgi:hypothetical protein